jgi:hypothetical protein
VGEAVTRKDLAEMRRRLEEIMFIAESGYEPVDLGPGEEPGWVKCRWIRTHPRRRPGGDRPR